MKITPENEHLFLALWGKTRKAIMSGTSAEVAEIVDAYDADRGSDNDYVKDDLAAIFTASHAITEWALAQPS